MKAWQVDWRKPWFHGADQEFDVLRPGSTITQRQDLSEAFSHQPTALWIDDDDQVGHNGRQDGCLYVIDEPISPEDLEPVPGSTMAPGLEWHTRRPLRVRMTARLPGVERLRDVPPTPDEFERALRIVGEVFRIAARDQRLSEHELYQWTEKILQTCYSICAQYGEDPVRAVALAAAHGQLAPSSEKT